MACFTVTLSRNTSVVLYAQASLCVNGFPLEPHEEVAVLVWEALVSVSGWVGGLLGGLESGARGGGPSATPTVWATTCFTMPTISPRVLLAATEASDPLIVRKTPKRLLISTVRRTTFSSSRAWGINPVNFHIWILFGKARFLFLFFLSFFLLYYCLFCLNCPVGAPHWIDPVEGTTVADKKNQKTDMKEAENLKTTYRHITWARICWFFRGPFFCRFKKIYTVAHYNPRQK